MDNDERVIILDDKTIFDRYTVIVGNDVYGMSSNPLHPQGFNQWAGTVFDLGYKNKEEFMVAMSARGDKEVFNLPIGLIKAICFRITEE